MRTLPIDTPIEEYNVQGKAVYVKREDLCSPFPGPNNAKIRGVYAHLVKLKQKGITDVGILDTKISRAGWVVAYCCSVLGLKCHDFYPIYKNDTRLRFQQLMAKSFGANLIPQKASKQSIRYARAKKYMREIKNSVMLPDMLMLPESVIEVSKVLKAIDDELLTGTVVVPVGSGTMLTGILKGLFEKNKFQKPKVYGILASNVTPESRYSNVCRLLKSFYPKHTRLATQIKLRLKILNCGFEYLTPEYYPSPFPCDIYYDRKAWKWLCEYIGKLEEPILFWNIGGEWDINGLDNGLRGDGIVTKEQVENYLAKKQ